MPKVFRVMKKDPDGFPTIGPKSLGVRPEVDIDLNHRAQFCDRSSTIEELMKNVHQYLTKRNRAARRAALAA